MLEIFVGWKLWQIVVTVVFGVVWIVFIVLDCRRKSKLKKLRKEREELLKSCGYPEEAIEEILNSRRVVQICKEIEEEKKQCRN